MNSELNDYKITNTDGIIKSNDTGIKFSNDSPHYIEENSLSNQNEHFSENEQFDLDKKDESKDTSTSKDTGSLSNPTSVTTSAISSSSTAISSGLGSIIGGVASSVATAVIVVAAFVSALVINIALVMAGTSSLVFQLEMIGAQKEDFENKTYYAILEGNGYKQSQEIFMDTVYVTFEDLEPGTEYTITIRNDEKIFAQKSYFTASYDDQKGFLEAWYEEDTVYAWVNFRELKQNEFYTFTATDGQGKVLLKNSDVKPEKEYSFNVESSDTITFTLSVNGKVCCFEQLSVELEPSTSDDPQTEGDHQHNYIPSGFVWSYDQQDQLVAVGEGICEDCEDVLTIPAEISRDGDLVIASIAYNGTTYTDKRVEIDLTGKENVISENNCYFIKATNYVLGNIESENTIRYNNDSEHPYTIKGTAEDILNCINVYNSGLSILNVGYRTDYYFEFNNLNITASSKDYSSIFSVQTKYDVTIHIMVRGYVSFVTSDAYAFAVENTGENDVTVTFDITYVDSDSSFRCYDDLLECANLYSPEFEDSIIFEINGVQVDCNGEPIYEEEPEEYESNYDFTQGSWAWSNDNLTAYLSFPDMNGGEPYVVEAFVQEMETPAGCEEVGSIVYTASVYVELADEIFSDEQTVTLEPIGHDYGEPVFTWTQNGNDGPTATATFTCLNDSSHELVLNAEVTIDTSSPQMLQYVATVTYNNVTYTDYYS